MKCDGLSAILRERDFDLTIDFQRKFRTSLLTYLSGAKSRVGYHQPNGVLCTIRVPDRNNKAIRAGQVSSAHAVDRYFEMLHAIGVEATDRTLEMFITHADRAFFGRTYRYQGHRGESAEGWTVSGSGMEVTRMDAGSFCSDR